MNYQLYCCDCVDKLKEIESDSVSAVFTDPPYPEIKRDYGKINTNDWHQMMLEVVRQCKRILKDDGSAVFVLQPNSEKVGAMRIWLWEFLVWAAKEWNMIQDVYWFNTAAMPNVHSQRRHGLMRPAVKMCVWLGPPDAYRNQDKVLIKPCKAPKNSHDELIVSPSGYSIRHKRAYGVPLERGGATPFNLVQFPNTYNASASGAFGHGAGTPAKLTRWWVRYITKPGDTILDPFSGVGTTGLICLEEGRNYIGIENYPEYHQKAEERLNRFLRQTSLSLAHSNDSL